MPTATTFGSPSKQRTTRTNGSPRAMPEGPSAENVAMNATPRCSAASAATASASASDGSVS